MYKADTLEGFDSRYPDGKNYQWEGKWRPSIHMPKSAARIWLRVVDVKVERLQDILKSPCGKDNQVVKEGFTYTCDFIAVWENTIKESERYKYGWNANPYVWVITFERCNPITTNETDEQRTNNQKMFKLRIYHTEGSSKGNLKNEEYFENMQDLNRRYGELFQYQSYSLNPTAWEKKEGKWERLSGY